MKRLNNTDVSDFPSFMCPLFPNATSYTSPSSFKVMSKKYFSDIYKDINLFEQKKKKKEQTKKQQKKKKKKKKKIRNVFVKHYTPIYIVYACACRYKMPKLKRNMTPTKI